MLLILKVQDFVPFFENDLYKYTGSDNNDVKNALLAPTQTLPLNSRILTAYWCEDGILPIEN